MLTRVKFPVRIFVVSLVALFFFASGLAAQDADGGAWAEATEGVMSVYAGMAKLMKGIILIGGIVVLGDIIIKVMAGEREAARKLLWWLIGLAFGFIMIEVLEGAFFA